MTRFLILSLALALSFAGQAHADATSIANAHSEAFAKAAKACDAGAVLKLYEDDAVVIWPGRGQYAKGRAAIRKLFKNSCGDQGFNLKMLSQEARPVGKDYIINVGRWEQTVKGPHGRTETLQLRTTELLHRMGGKWRYVVDHASVGMAPQATKAGAH